MNLPEKPVTAQALAEPFAYAEYIQKQKQQKIEAERASPITTKKKFPKVNRDLAKHLLENQEAEGEAKTRDDVNMKKKSKKNKGLSNDLMEDERFTKMFENKDFEVNEQSLEYLSLHPQSIKKQPTLFEEHFELVTEDDDEQRIRGSDVASQSSEEGSDKDVNNLKNSKRVSLQVLRSEG